MKKTLEGINISITEAEEYISAGNYLWNSGMFMFKASTLLSELAKFESEMSTSVESAFNAQEKDLDFVRIVESKWSLKYDQWHLNLPEI